jgi:hypothetical protein
VRLHRPFPHPVLLAAGEYRRRNIPHRELIGCRRPQWRNAQTAQETEISCKSGISANLQGSLFSFYREAGFTAPILGLWKDAVLFRDMPGGEVAWMCAAPMGMMAAGGQRVAGDALTAWAEGVAGRRDEVRGRGACGSRSTGRSRPRTGRTR